MKSTLFFLSLFTVFFVSINCSKERIETKDSLNDYDPINSYFDSKKQPEQEFVIDTNGQGPIIGQQGTKIWAIKSNLMYPNGDSVYFPFIVKLIELYTPKDMIYYKMSNVASNVPLTTAGIVRIQAFKNGQELLLRPGKTWTIEMPAQQKLPNMKIYYGSNQSGNINWDPNPPGNFDTTSYGYLGLITKLGWISNSKQTIQNPTNVIVSFTSTTDNLQNVATYIYMQDLKSLIKVYNQTTNIFPTGEKAKVILIGTRQQQLYHYYWQGIINQNTSFPVTMTVISDANLTAILDTL